MNVSNFKDTNIKNNLTAEQEQTRPVVDRFFLVQLNKYQQLKGPSVVYFNQGLGATHSKRWLKQSFSAFFVLKTKKSKKFAAKFCKKQIFLSLHQNPGRLFDSQKFKQHRNWTKFHLFFFQRFGRQVWLRQGRYTFIKYFYKRLRRFLHLFSAPF